jgi:hypothetical protein
MCASRSHPLTPNLHRDEGELRLEAPEDRTPHLRGARPHDGARTVDVHPRPLSPDRLHHLRREELQEAEGVGVRHARRGEHEGRETLFNDQMRLCRPGSKLMSQTR